jgi:hypothetical protein
MDRAILESRVELWVADLSTVTLCLCGIKKIFISGEI